MTALVSPAPLTHPPPKFSFTRSELCCCHETWEFCKRRSLPIPPSLWGSRVEKLKWQRGGRRWGRLGAPCRQPARPRSLRSAVSPGLRRRSAAGQPLSRRDGVPGGRARSRQGSVGSPPGEGSEVEELTPLPLSALHPGEVSVQLGVAPSPGSFSRLGTGLCIHPGAPNLFLPGKLTAPPCKHSVPPRPSSPRPRRAAPTRPAPFLPPPRGQREPPPAPPHRAALSLPRPAAGGRCRAPGMRGSGARGRGEGEERDQQPPNANFLAPPAPQLVSYRRRGCREPPADWLPLAHL